jgi:hypothetical protein
MLWQVNFLVTCFSTVIFFITCLSCQECLGILLLHHHKLGLQGLSSIYAFIFMRLGDSVSFALHCVQ